MKKLSVITFLFAFTICGYAQNRLQVEKVLKQINKFNELDSLKRAHSKWEIKGEALSANDTINYPFLKKVAIGDIIKTSLENRNNQQFLVKVLDKEVQKLCRVQYIFLDGEKLSKKEIDSIRTEIHRRVQRGEKFHEMIPEYTMDGGSGDIGWFSKEMVVSEFYDPIVNKEKGEVFSVSIPKNNWFYIVKKTEDNIIRNIFYTIWIRLE